MNVCENILRCCRICLDIESEHVPILQNPSIQLHLKTCLSITVSTSDELPKSVCKTCVSQLNDFYNFHLNARCSNDWLESSIQEKAKRSTEIRMTVQPLPDSEYNSDSLLEFLNNTANIEEYLNNLGKEDIPSIMSMLDKNGESNIEEKIASPIKSEIANTNVNMEIDVLDSDIEIVKELLIKETDPKMKIPKSFICFACSTKCDTMKKLSQHLSICEKAERTCSQCLKMLDSKTQMIKHRLSNHVALPSICHCGKTLNSKDQVLHHYKICKIDYLTASLGCTLSCKQCGDVFQDRVLLYRHVKQHILKDEERICDICGQIVIGEETLVKHRQDVHGKSKDLLYRCKVCKFTSSDRKETFIHVQNHTLTEEISKHLCEMCGRCFSSHTSLMRHAILHGAAGYNCNICDKQFMNKKLRDEHILQHIDIVMCEKCGQTINSYKLDAHFCV